MPFVTRMAAAVDKLPPKAQSLLELARHGDDPTPAQRARSDTALREVLSRHGVRDLPQLASTAGAEATLAQRSLPLLKLGAGAFALVVATAAYFGMRAPHSSSAPVAAPPMAASARTAPRGDSSSPTTAVESSSSSVLDDPPSSNSEPAAPRRELRARAIEAHTPVPHASSSSDDTLQAELRTLAAADQLVRAGQFSGALQLLKGTERSAAGVLREERTALRILAQCGLAPGLRIRRERDQFLKTWPRSVLAERVRNACGAVAE
jgi:hypothetical protein